MAAARGDQVAETASSRQPAAPTRQASDVAPGSAIVTHTAAPERPANSGPQDSAKEASCNQEGSGMLDSLCRNSAAATAAAAAAAADGLTASTGSQTSTHSRLQAGDSAAQPAEEEEPPASRQEDEEEGIASPTTSQGDSRCSEDDSQAAPQYHNEDSTDQLVTDDLEGPSGGGVTQGGVAVNRDEGRSQRSVRTPLAAVQEAVTPMLGSLSFKQAVHGKHSHGKLRCLLLMWFASFQQARLMEAAYTSTWAPTPAYDLMPGMVFVMYITGMEIVSRLLCSACQSSVPHV